MFRLGRKHTMSIHASTDALASAPVRSSQAMSRVRKTALAAALVPLAAVAVPAQAVTTVESAARIDYNHGSPAYSESDSQSGPSVSTYSNAYSYTHGLDATGSSSAYGV